jgi:hypothetical protein
VPLSATLLIAPAFPATPFHGAAIPEQTHFSGRQMSGQDEGGTEEEGRLHAAHAPERVLARACYKAFSSFTAEVAAL